MRLWSDVLKEALRYSARVGVAAQRTGRGTAATVAEADSAARPPVTAGRAASPVAAVVVSPVQFLAPTRAVPSLFSDSVAGASRAGSRRGVGEDPALWGPHIRPVSQPLSARLSFAECRRRPTLFACDLASDAVRLIPHRRSRKKAGRLVANLVARQRELPALDHADAHTPLSDRTRQHVTTTALRLLCAIYGQYHV